MSRTAEKPIVVPFVQELMDLLECGDSYTVAERKTGISEGTWRSWANGTKSPLSTLEFVYNLESKTGKSLKDLIDGFRRNQD